MARLARLFVPLDVEFATDDKILAAGPLAAYLYVCSLAYAKRSGKEGFIHAGQVQILAPGLTKTSTHAQKLSDVGLWAPVEGGWTITAWARHNLSGDQLTERKEMQRAKAIAGNHQRHHVAKKVTEPDCELCQNGPHRELPKSPQGDGMVPRNREGRGIEKEEGEEEEEGEGNSPTSQNGSSKARIATVVGESSERRIDVIRNYVRLAIEGMEQRGEPIKSRSGLERHLTEQVTAMANLQVWPTLFPTAPAGAIAAWLHGDKGSMRYYPRADELAAQADGPHEATIHELRPPA